MRYITSRVQFLPSSHEKVLQAEASGLRRQGAGSVGSLQAGESHAKKFTATGTDR